MKTRMLAMAMAAGALAMTGCMFHIDAPAAGPVERSTETVAKEKVAKAEYVEVGLNIGAGELRLEGGAKEFFEGQFAYSVPSWKPTVRYDGSSFRGRLEVNQGKGSGTFGNVKNEWKLKLANDVPVELKVNCGAGESHLNLRELNLKRVEVHMGAGQVDLDLRDQSQRNLEVVVEGGVGEATVRVPKEAGVRAEASGGIGSVKVTGMEKVSGAWQTEAFGKAKSTMRIRVNGGIGQINIHAE